MTRAGWRAVATVAFLATLWFLLVPYSSTGTDGEGAPVNCGPAIAFGGGDERDAAGCPETSAVRVQQGLITMAFGIGVHMALGYARSKDPTRPEPKGASHYA